MRLERKPPDFLRDMLDAIEKTERFTEGMSFEQFANDDRTTLAVIKAIEIAGEAAKNIPEAVRSRHPSVPWRGMAAMRDRLTHGYFTTSLQIVWSTVRQDFPDAKPQIIRALEEETRREDAANG